MLDIVALHLRRNGFKYDFITGRYVSMVLIYLPVLFELWKVVGEASCHPRIQMVLGFRSFNR